MTFFALFPLIILFFVSVGFVWGAYWLLLKRNVSMDNERKFPRQMLVFGLAVLSLLVFVSALPISDNARNQLLSLIAIIISALVTFSSATITANLTAGMLMRITKHFRVGDFVEIGEHFGRVSERGLFHMEIQTETSKLVTLPNTYCINQPMTTTRRSGTVIYASLSLGYDLDHKNIEILLLEAGNACGLADPFVHVMELGDFSVTYRISGLLDTPKRLISAQSDLYKSVLDTLHKHDIEIVSPAFVNQHQMSHRAKSIPPRQCTLNNGEPSAKAEAVIFDKAEKAAQLEQEKKRTEKHIEELKIELKEASPEEKTYKTEILEKRKSELENLKAIQIDEED